MALAVGALPPFPAGWGARAPSAPPVPTPMKPDLLFGPKNHSIVGGGTLDGRGLGVIVAEHIRVAFSPAVLEPKGEMVTSPNIHCMQMILP